MKDTVHKLTSLELLRRNQVTRGETHFAAAHSAAALEWILGEYADLGDEEADDVREAVANADRIESRRKPEPAFRFNSGPGFDNGALK